MNPCKTEQEYLNAIIPAVQRVCKRYGYLPSVLIAQSCLENGYGIPDYWDNPQIEALMKYNNMVGIKSELLSSSWADKTVWPGKSLTKQTPEEYGGKVVTITDNFRKYDNIEQSFADYLLFMTYASNYGKGGSPKYGLDVINIRDPEKLIQAVKDRGYATGSTYPKNVMKIVNKHNLTKYDDLSGVEPTKYTPGYKEGSEQPASGKVPLGEWPIVKSAGYNDQVPAWGNTNEYIGVHYLGVDGQNDSCWSGGDGAHYYVYWDGVIHNGCDLSACPWQVGTAGGTYKKKHAKANNSNVIGIEMCCHNTDGYCPETASGEKHWYFTEATQRAAAFLVRKLMKEKNIPIKNVLRHFDIVNKNCPAPYVYNNRYKGSWTWDEFIEAVKTGYCPDGSAVEPVKPDTPSDPPAEKKATLRKGSTGPEVALMQAMLIACGYKCGSAGADGQFGNDTLKALKRFQKKKGLSADGIYGPKSREALEKAYQDKLSKANAKKVSAFKTVNAAAKAVCDMGKERGWKYGDSHSAIPCNDGKISCDRLIARYLYNMGFRDQRAGGEMCDTLDAYLTSHGWTKVKDRKLIKAGAVVAVRNKGEKHIAHVFHAAGYNKTADTCTKFDTGSDERIQSKQPFRNVKLVEWPNREFVCAWNPPAWLSSSKPGTYVFGGVDYSHVFNPTYYRKMYPDLQKAFGTDTKKLFDHFIHYGMAEGRQAYAGFNPKAYRERYEDLDKAFGNDMKQYYKHYCEYGKKENRIGT